ncbi:hypothetical protein EVAR_41262_1 [Eumeta japonica]|uniref:Uncharacterized protein n=1 Tax=Eumeta variegata TaxID=151549 RepID=A0A4C1W4Y7_EUMVA|nr:hypothetical protein EVAR_41262_1 [Eumeta japonica]
MSDRRSFFGSSRFSIVEFLRSGRSGDPPFHHIPHTGDEFRDGRPSTAVNNKNIDAVRRMIETDMYVTYHAIQAALAERRFTVSSPPEWDHPLAGARHPATFKSTRLFRCRQTPKTDRHYIELRSISMPILRVIQRTKLCRSELAANGILRRYYTPRPVLLIRRVSILRHCDAFVTNFTAAKLPCGSCGGPAHVSAPYRGRAAVVTRRRLFYGLLSLAAVAGRGLPAAPTTYKLRFSGLHISGVGEGPLESQPPPSAVTMRVCSTFLRAFAQTGGC